MTSYNVRFVIKNSGLDYAYSSSNVLTESVEAKDLKSAKNKLSSKYLKRVNTQRKYNKKADLKRLVIEIKDYTINGYF